MADKIIMPKQGLQMTEGLITAWLAGEGDAVRAGEPLFEMETDKLVITIDSPVSGTLLKIVAPEGTSVPITETIAIVGETGEDISGLLGSGGYAVGAGGSVRREIASRCVLRGRNDVGKKHSVGGRVFISPRAKRLADEWGLDWINISGSAPDGMIVERDVRAVKAAVEADSAAAAIEAAKATVKADSAAAAIESAASSPIATPLAKKLASMAGIDLYGIEGSGERGKIFRADVEAALEGARAAGVIKKTATVQAAAERQRIVPFSNMRRIIANRMTKSLNEGAQAVHRISVYMDEAARVREARGKSISYSDIVALAVIRALRDYPSINAEWTDSGIMQKHYVNLGVAVALEHGLVVPVIKDAHLMSLDGVSEALKTLAQKARDNKLNADDCAGGSFTVSNLGMYGLDEFTAIINPPESGILAVGKIGDAPVAIDGNVEIRKVMKLTLTYDHRVIDGAPAARFLSRVKDYLETPYLML
ncbi:MAG: 2-oxo acid dehydrogenase subunit E2 [Oscillospiraceae bacterium]|nr:2-oxo acid dehydrogenase subunit E2 [Oscillospiraceae bacterium]